MKTSTKLGRNDRLHTPMTFNAIRMLRILNRCSRGEGMSKRCMSFFTHAPSIYLPPGIIKNLIPLLDGPTSILNEHQVFLLLGTIGDTKKEAVSAWQ